MLDSRTLCIIEVQNGPAELRTSLSHKARRTHVNTTLDYKKDFLCVLTESEISDGPRGALTVKEWHAVHAAEEAEARTLVGRPVIPVDSGEGIYVDEEGNVFQLAEKGRSKPMEVEQFEREQEPAGADAQTSANGRAPKEGKPLERAASDNHNGKVRKERQPNKKRSVSQPTPNLPMDSARTSMTAQQEKMRVSQRRCLRS
jgi:hypothetical protein